MASAPPAAAVESVTVAATTDEEFDLPSHAVTPQAKYYHRHRTAELARSAAWVRAHPDAAAVIGKRWRDSPQGREWRKNYYMQNRARILAYNRSYKASRRKRYLSALQREKMKLAEGVIHKEE